MTDPRFPTRSNIDGELLSAYIDGQVTAAERQRVEQALATDAQIWERYEALRMTVSLMQSTPRMPVPRAFALSEAQVLAAGGKVKGVKQPGFWERLFPRFMPLAAAATALLLVVLISVDLLTGLGGGTAAHQPAMQEMELAAAPVREEPAPMELPAESEVAAVEIIKKVELTVVVEKEVARTAESEMLAEREPAGDSAMSEPNAASTATETNQVGSTEAPLAAAPPPAAAAEMAEDETEPMVGAASASAETSLPDKKEDRTPAWLRPLELILALLFVIFLALTILSYKQRHTDAP